MCAMLRFGARLALRLQPGNLCRFQQILGGALARQAARRPNLPNRPPAQSVQQTAILAPQAPPAARRRPGHGLPPAAGPRQEARPVCSKPHHRACGRMGPRRMVRLCAGHGSREAQRKMRECSHAHCRSGKKLGFRWEIMINVLFINGIHGGSLLIKRCFNGIS